MNPAATPQPAPQPGKQIVVEAVLESIRVNFIHPASLKHLIMDDLSERAAVGLQKYGRLLETHNGRDALMDLYQEALDGVMYAAQYLLEAAQDTPEYEERLFVFGHAQVLLFSVAGRVADRSANELIP